MKTAITTIVIACTLSLAGCATKNYGRQGVVTDFEQRTLTCREIELERAKVEGFLQQVDKESQFDGLSILSFLGDFGIGNAIEHASAVDSANKRMKQLDNMYVQKGCPA